MSFLPRARLFAALLLAVLFVAGAAPHAQAATTAKVAAVAPLEVSGWIPYWRTATGTADALAHLSAFTTINPFGYTVKTDGTLYDTMNVNQDPWASLIAAAHAKKVRVIPTVMWSDTNAIDRILSNATSRQALEDNIANLVKQNGFDGIDIDFEGKKAEDKVYFATFLKGLYARMGNKWVSCTIEARTPVSSRYDGTPPADATTYANDFVAINKYCDRVNLMTYDQGSIDVQLNASKTGPYVPVADPAWITKVVNLTAQTISKKKLVIGIATYGYEYDVTPLTQGYRYDLDWAFNPKYALSLASSLGISPVRNQAGELSFSYQRSALPQSVLDAAEVGNITSSGTGEVSSTSISSGASNPSSSQPFNLVWWSDAQAIKAKVDLARQLGVKGVAIFKIDGGEDPAMWSVLPKK
jgi:spore germination protein YaaH